MLNGDCVERTDYTTIQNAILDAGPIIHLEEIGSLSLLLDFKRLIIPDAVWYEVAYHRPAVFEHKDVNFEKVNVVLDEDILSVCRLFCLDNGEVEAIAVCSQYPDSILLTDDASARLAAKTLGIRAYGTIGVLLRAIRRKLLTPHEVIGKLEEIPLKSTLFIRRSLLREIIVEVKRVK
jgi:predicted nucleic acid-binding protein